MAVVSTSESRATSTRHKFSFWGRRAALLGAFGLSFGLAGPSWTVDAVAPGTTQPLIPAVTDQLAMWVTIPAHARSVESLGLLVLGLSLIGAGRLLARQQSSQW